MGLYLNTQRYIQGDLNVLGYINSRKSGVFAYLTTPADTTTGLAEAFTPIQGVFENNPLEDFILDVDKLKYVGTQSAHFETDWHASLQCTNPNRTVNVTISVNGTPLAIEEMPIFCKTAGEPYNTSGTAGLNLKYGDTVQLVCSSDVGAEKITFNNFVTSLGRLFF
jgi:hypothetical protein